MQRRAVGDYKQYLSKEEKNRWASIEEIKETTALINSRDKEYSAAGMPLMSDGERIYVDNTDTHSIIFGSTGSKKTRLFCLPTINIFCKAGESFIVSDPKGELFERTSGMAKKCGYKVITIDYRNIGLGDMWNPLTLPYELYHSGNKDEASAMLNDFVNTISSNLKGGDDAYWVSMARSLALSNLMLLMEIGTKEQVHPASLARISTGSDISKVMKINENFISPDSTVGRNYNGVFSTASAEKTFGCIKSFVYSMVQIFNIQEDLSKMLSESTFDLSMIGREKTAIYIITPDEKSTYNFLITTFIKQTYQVLISESQKERDGKLPVRVNFVLDEFCNIPKIDDMPAMISAARSRNIRFYIFVQGNLQLRAVYGDSADTIKGNCENWVFLASKERELLDEISALCGSNGNKPLITTSELQHLRKDRGEALILHCRNYPMVTELADIDDYEAFTKIPAMKRVKRKFKELSFPDLDIILASLKEDDMLFGSKKVTLENDPVKVAVNLKAMVEKELSLMDEKIKELRERDAVEARKKQQMFRQSLQDELEQLLRTSPNT